MTLAQKRRAAATCARGALPRTTPSRLHNPRAARAEHQQQRRGGATQALRLTTQRARRA